MVECGTYTLVSEIRDALVLGITVRTVQSVQHGYLRMQHVIVSHDDKDSCKDYTDCC